MDFTASGLSASLLPASFYLIGWLGLAWLAWRWLMSGDWRLSLDYLLSCYTPYATLLIGWAEAFISGMAITMMAAYRPAWLETFDDARYIRNK